MTITDNVLVNFPQSNAYQFEVKGSFSQNVSIDKGNHAWSQTVDVKLTEAYGKVEITNLTRGFFRVIVLTNNNQYLMFGTKNGMECTVSHGSGEGKSEFNGATVSFTGLEDASATLVEDIDEFFDTVVGVEQFNYDLNFNL